MSAPGVPAASVESSDEEPSLSPPPRDLSDPNNESDQDFEYSTQTPALVVRPWTADEDIAEEFSTRAGSELDDDSVSTHVDARDTPLSASVATQTSRDDPAEGRAREEVIGEEEESETEAAPASLRVLEPTSAPLSAAPLGLGGLGLDSRARLALRPASQAASKKEEEAEVEAAPIRASSAAEDAEADVEFSAVPSPPAPAVFSQAERLLLSQPPSSQPPSSQPPSSQPPSSQPSSSHLSSSQHPSSSAAALAMPYSEPDPDSMAGAVQRLRVDLLRACLRFGVPAHHSVVQQTLYRLGMAARLFHSAQPSGGPAQSSQLGSAGEDARAGEAAARAEAEQTPLSLRPCVLVLGLKGGGKTSTLRSLLDAGRGLEGSWPAFQAGARGVYDPTASISVQRGSVCGIPVTAIDTPGLLAGSSTQARAFNRRALARVARALAAHRPDTILWVDRLDAARRDGSDAGVLEAVAQSLGPEVWYNTTLVLTHAGSAATLTGAQHAPLGLDALCSARQQQALQALRRASGDARLINPAAFAENGSGCSRDSAGEPLVQAPAADTPWRPHLAVLLASSATLHAANELLRPGKTTVGARSSGRDARSLLHAYQGMGTRVPPLGWLLARLVDFRSPRKLPDDERDLVPEARLRSLPRERLEEALAARTQVLAARAEEARSGGELPLPAPDPGLPPSFDVEAVRAHRYGVLEDPNLLLVRPVLAEVPLDHDDGVEAVQAERSAVLRPLAGGCTGGWPALAWAQVRKDKAALALQAEAEASARHAPGLASTAALNVQLIQGDVLYTARAETKKKLAPGVKAAAGVLVSRLTKGVGNPLHPAPTAVGAKLESRLKTARGGAKLRLSAGLMQTRMPHSVDRGQALAADLRWRVPRRKTLRLSAGGSLVRQAGSGRRAQSAVGVNLSAEGVLPDGMATLMGGRQSDTHLSAGVNLSNKGTGALTLRMASSQNTGFAWLMALPLARAVVDRCWEAWAARKERRAARGSGG